MDNEQLTIDNEEMPWFLMKISTAVHHLLIVNCGLSIVHWNRYFCSRYDKCLLNLWRYCRFRGPSDHVLCADLLRLEKHSWNSALARAGHPPDQGCFQRSAERDQEIDRRHPYGFQPPAHDGRYAQRDREAVPGTRTHTRPGNELRASAPVHTTISARSANRSADGPAGSSRKPAGRTSTESLISQTTCFCRADTNMSSLSMSRLAVRRSYCVLL